MDVDSLDSVNAAIAEAGEIDVLINNAGILSYDTIEDESQERMEAVMNTNYFGVVRCTKAVVPMMRKESLGSYQYRLCRGNHRSSTQCRLFIVEVCIEAFSEILAQELYPLASESIWLSPVSLIHRWRPPNCRYRKKTACTQRVVVSKLCLN